MAQKKVNEVWIEDGLPKKKWYKTDLFKLILALIPSLIIFVQIIMYIGNKSVDSAVSNVRKNYTDSLQWLAIEQKGSSINAVNIRVDTVTSKIYTQNANLTNVSNKLDVVVDVMSIILCKINKDLIPLLHQRNVEFRMIDSRSNSNYRKNYVYNDSLSVWNYINKSVGKFPDKITDETFEDIYTIGEKPKDYKYNTAYDNIFNDSYESPFENKQSPLQYYLFLNQFTK